MATDWTPQQTCAIEEPIKNIMVSAAAGSGKTAVLARRITEYVIAGNSTENLLVVTFTKASAAEMKARVAANLKTALEEDPKNEHLQREHILVQKALICTIDSFLNNITRKNFQRLGISNNFKIADEGEFLVIRDRVFNRMLENEYASGSKRILSIERIFGGDYDQKKIADAIYSFAESLEAVPFRKGWCEFALSTFDNVDLWTKKAKEYVINFLKDATSLYDFVFERSNLPDGNYAFLSEEYKIFADLLKRSYSLSWDELREALPKSFEKIKTNNAPDEAYNIFKPLRLELVHRLKGDGVFAYSTEMVQSDIKELHVCLEDFFSFTNDFCDEIFLECNRKNLFTFKQITNMALSLFVESYDHETKKAVFSQDAKDLKKSFSQILIDEYQDTNPVQDLIFTSISNNNLFVVGDQKQSIYAFRDSDPSLFLEKAASFKNIHLNKNFRSAEKILRFTNKVYATITSEENGDTPYTKEDELYFGRDDMPENENVECVFIEDCPQNNQRIESAIRYSASRIKKMVLENEEIYDKKLKVMRPCKYSDFAILLRSISTKIDICEAIFREYGIPIHINKSTSLLQTVECHSILALLHTIDNPYDDVYLFGAMVSPLFSFSSEELAKIRNRKKNAPLYEAVLEASKTDQKASAFIENVSRFDFFAKNMSLSDFLRKLYNETNALKIFSSTENGKAKKNNLLTLYNFAKKYEEYGHSGLYGFLDFIEKIIEKSKLEGASVAQSADCVNIMSIHGSKGLEFNVCILCDTYASLLGKERVPSVLFDRNYGVFFPYRDRDITYERPTLMQLLVSDIKDREEISEAKRLLYVALTRACQKLIIISTDFRGCHGNSVLLDQSGKLYRCFASFAHKFSDLLHPVTAGLESGLFIKKIFSVDDLTTATEQASDSPSRSYDFEERFSFSYENKVLSSIPAKVSVTELIKNKLFDENSKTLDTLQRSSSRPAFLSAKKSSAADKGSALHRFLEKADFSQKIDDEIERLKNKGFLSEEQALLLDKEKISAFYESSLFKEITASKSIRREEFFLTQIPATEFNKTAPGGETVLLQGATDLLCEDDDGLILVDYKTDSVSSPEELKDRYYLQIDLYKKALEKTRKKPIKKAVIWSFSLSQEILM